jgi:hypothetical protein
MQRPLGGWNMKNGVVVAADTNGHTKEVRAPSMVRHRANRPRAEAFTVPLRKITNHTNAQERVARVFQTDELGSKEPLINDKRRTIILRRECNSRFGQM